MAKKLRCVIFGITDVIVQRGEIIPDLFSEIGRLIAFLSSKGILPVFYGNHDWVITDDCGKQKRLQNFITERWGELPWYIVEIDRNIPYKGTKAGTQYILNDLGFDQTEAVYVGNSDRDMQTAINGNILFLNVRWYSRNNQYGFFFDSPLDIARFIDTFCLRDSLWHYQIEAPSLRYYALAPYSTRIPEFSYLSSDARAAAKFGMGHVDFWTKYLFSTIYFSELYKEIDYITVVPSSRAGSLNVIMANPMSIFANCFHQKFLKDFVIRHTTIEPSHNAWQSGIERNHKRQLNSIVLNEHPEKSPGNPYKFCPVREGKTVLLMDDILTLGYSMDSAKLFIEQTGAQVICMSWLKTINSNYHQMIGEPFQFNPFVVKTDFYDPPPGAMVSLTYSDFIRDDYAPEELKQKLCAYDDWTWPTGI